MELSKECGTVPVLHSSNYNASRTGAGLQFTSSTAERSPFPYEGKDLTRLNVGVTANVRKRGNASLAT